VKKLNTDGDISLFIHSSVHPVMPSGIMEERSVTQLWTFGTGVSDEAFSLIWLSSRQGSGLHEKPMPPSTGSAPAENQVSSQ